MFNKTKSTDASVNGIGANAKIGGDVNLSIEHKSENKKWYFGKDFIVPVLVGLITTIGGAYGKHYFDLMRAPEITVANTSSLLGIANEVAALARNGQQDPAFATKLQELVEQARATEALAKLLSNGSKGVAQRADFWLKVGYGGIRLGDDVSLGIQGVTQDNRVSIILNNTPLWMSSGGHVEFHKDGDNCFATYVSKSVDNMLLGFNVVCNKKISK